MADRVEEVLDVVSSGHSSESCLVNAKRRKAKSCTNKKPQRKSNSQFSKALFLSLKSSTFSKCISNTHAYLPILVWNGGRIPYIFIFYCYVVYYLPEKRRAAVSKWLSFVFVKFRQKNVISANKKSMDLPALDFKCTFVSLPKTFSKVKKREEVKV